MSWNVIQRHAEPMPWDDEWHDHWLSEQEFWQKLARSHGNLIALRCYERRWINDDVTEEEWESGKRPLGLGEIFTECREIAHEWMMATNEDERAQGHEQWNAVMLQERKNIEDVKMIARLALARGGVPPEMRERWVVYLYRFERHQAKLRYAQGIWAEVLDGLERDRAA